MPEHNVTVMYRCGHHWKFTRAPGGVSDWLYCLCESCCPWDGVVTSGNNCRKCGGDGSFIKSNVVPIGEAHAL